MSAKGNFILFCEKQEKFVFMKVRSEKEMATRGEKLRVHLILLAVIAGVICGMLPIVSAANVLDVSGHWAEIQINDWIGKGLAKGYPDGTFKPDNEISRVEFMSLVNRAFNFEAKKEIAYSDVPAGGWAADVVAAARAAGYITGYEDGTMRPNNPISRDEAAAIIYRVKKLEQNIEAADRFTDSADIPAWSKGMVGAAAEADIITGYPDGSFRAKDLIKRCEALVALDRAITKRHFVYNVEGVYGHSEGFETINGNVTVETGNVTLQNMIIEGDFTVSKLVGNGNVTLRKVTVKGNTYIYGGGENSVYFIDSNTGKTYVLKDDGPVRIVVSGTSSISQLTAQSNIKVEEVDLTGSGIEGIVVDRQVDGNIEISLTGVNVESLDIQSDGVTVNADNTTQVSNLQVSANNVTVTTQQGTTIGTLVADGTVAVTGNGTIQNAVVNTSGVTFETQPENTEVVPDVIPPVVESKPEEKPEDKPSTGGGSSTVKVSAISVSGEGNATAITTNNGTLQMSAAIVPTNATNKNVTWLVENGTGEATISTEGLLTAVKNGIVTVKATAKDRSGKYGEKEIVISGQIPVISTVSTIASGDADPVVVVTLAKDTFTEGATDPANWTGGLGTTKLKGDSITRNSDTQITFKLKGTAQAGTLTIQAQAAALASGVVSNTITIEVPVTISHITDVSMDMCKGSIMMDYTFKAGENVITYQNAITDEYALDSEASTVTLYKDGALIGKPVKLSELSIGTPYQAQQSGRTIFTNFQTFLSVFGLDSSKTEDIPTNVKVSVKSKTTVEGNLVSNPWGPIEFEKAVDSNLYAYLFIDPDKSTASIPTGTRTAGLPFIVTITLKDANGNNLPDGRYIVGVLNGNEPLGGGPHTFTAGQTTVGANLSTPGNHTITVKVDNILIETLENVVTVSSPKLQTLTTTTDGNEIHLTFDKAMADPSDKETQFTVTVDDTKRTITNAKLKEGGSSTIVLTLETSLAGSVNITVAYDRGDVAAADNGLLCTFAPTPVPVEGQLVAPENYSGSSSWSAAITADGIDFREITKADAIKMGIATPDYYGIAMDLKVNGKVVQLSTANLSKVERVKPGGAVEEPLITAEGTVQFVHTGWGETGKYTMRYYLKDGGVVEIKLNVVSFIFKDKVVPVEGQLVAPENYSGSSSWSAAITADGIDFREINKADAIKMGIANPEDYYGIAMDLKVNGEVVPLSTANLSKVERVKPGGAVEEPLITAEGTVQFVHTGWDETGKYTMRYYLKDGGVVEIKLNVVSFIFKDEIKPEVIFTFTGIDDATAGTVGFSITTKVTDNKAIANDTPLRYKAVVTKDGSALADQVIKYPEATDVEWPNKYHTFTTDSNGIAYFGPSAGFTLTQLPALLSAEGVTTPFQADFAVGEYSVTVSLLDIRNSGEVVLGSGTKTFSVGCAATLSAAEPAPAVVGTVGYTRFAGSIDVTSTVKTGDINAYYIFEITSGSLAEGTVLEYYHYETTNWLSFAVEGKDKYRFGDVKGFDLKAVDKVKTEFQANIAGESIKGKAYLVDVATGKIISNVVETTITAAPTLAATLSAAGPDIAVAGTVDYTRFAGSIGVTSTVKAGDINAYYIFEITSGSLAEGTVLKYYHYETTNWLPFAVEGEGKYRFGNSSGFDLKAVDGAITEFQANIAGGSIKGKAYLVDAATKKVISNEVETTINAKPVSE